jgi:hypothetical protein
MWYLEAPMRGWVSGWVCGLVGGWVVVVVVVVAAAAAVVVGGCAGGGRGVCGGGHLSPHMWHLARAASAMVFISRRNRTLCGERGA